MRFDLRSCTVFERVGKVFGEDRRRAASSKRTPPGCLALLHESRMIVRSCIAEFYAERSLRRSLPPKNFSTSVMAAVMR